MEAIQWLKLQIPVPTADLQTCNLQKRGLGKFSMHQSVSPQNNNNNNNNLDKCGGNTCCNPSTEEVWQEDCCDFKEYSRTDWLLQVVHMEKLDVQVSELITH